MCVPECVNEGFLGFAWKLKEFVYKTKLYKLSFSVSFCGTKIFGAPRTDPFNVFRKLGNLDGEQMIPTRTPES